MNFFELPEKIVRYADTHSTDEDPLLVDLYRTTYLKTVHPQMITGKVQGQYLTMLSRMIRPGQILEIGTFTGYSAYCLSKGLKENGKLTTIEVNEEVREIASDFFRRAGISQQVDLLLGDALEIIPQLQGMFDLVYIDGNKEHYTDYYKVCIEKVRRGGYIIADNVLWGGKVAEDPEQDPSTKRMHQFNEMITQDSGVENVLLTIRDGIMLIRKC